ncbi:hypothetical protein E4U42_003918 [Claviceps africana]|uniref:Uncharacterized protein n=1 Tax=Claviceps africana TaxID=83212 RepID=A0A8K0J5Y3_9HYPO|nr:hypothetical protein E4U42_003918 [Claviceps africana]
MPRFSFTIGGRKKQSVQPPPPPQLYAPMSKAHKILGSTPLAHDTPVVWHDLSSSTTINKYGASAVTTNAAAGHPDLGLQADEYDDDDDDMSREKPYASPQSLRLDAMIRPNSVGTATIASTEQSRKSPSSSPTLRSWYRKAKSPLSPSHQTTSPSTIAKPFTPPHTPQGLAPLHEGAERTASTDSRHPSRPPRLQATSQEDDATVSIQDDSSTTLEMDRMLTSPSTSSSSFKLFPPPSRQFREPRKGMIKSHVPVPGHGPPGPSNGGMPRPNCRNVSPQLLPSLHNHDEERRTRQVARQSSTPNLHATNLDGRLALRRNAAPSISQIPETPRTTLGFFPERPASSPGGRPARSICSRFTKTSRNTQRSMRGKDLLENSVLMLSSDSEGEDDDQNLDYQGLYEARYSTSQGNRTSSSSSDMYVATLPNSANRRRTDSGSVASRSVSLCGDQAPTVASSGSSVISDRSTSSSAMSSQDDSEFDIREARAIALIPARRLSDLDMEARMKGTSVPFRAPPMDQPTPPVSPTSIDFYVRSAHSSIDGGLASPTRFFVVTQQEEMLISALRHKQHTKRQTSMSLISEGNEQEKDTAQTSKGRTSTKSPPMDRPLRFADTSSDSLSERDAAAAEVRHSNGFPERQGPQPGTPSTIEFGFPTPPSFRQSSCLRPTRAADGRKPTVAPIRTSGLGDGVAVVPYTPSGPPPIVCLPALPQADQRELTSGSPSRRTASTQGSQDVSILYDDDDDDEPSPDLDDIRDWEAATSPVYVTSSWRQEQDRPRWGGGGQPVSPSGADSLLHPNSCSRWSNGKGAPSDATSGHDIPRPDSPISPEYSPMTRSHKR